MVDRAELQSAALLRVGQTVGERWRLERVIGLGGMAAVYAARHRNGRRVAIKILHAAYAASKRHTKRFLREAYVANAVGHPAIVAVDDDGVCSDGTPFFVMELLHGSSLATLASQAGGRLSPSDLIALMTTALDALAAAHLAGVVHRDLKPDNLFVTTGGQLKVLDFGVARACGDFFAGSAVDTQMGWILGTPAFMPPEQARGAWGEVDPRSDLWALAATMFTLLTGEYVHAAGTPNELLGRAMVNSARAIDSVHRGLSPALVRWFERALRFERSERFASATEMLSALLAVPEGLEVHATIVDQPVLAHRSEDGAHTLALSVPAPSQSRERRRAARMTAVLLTAFAGLSSTLWSLSTSRELGPPRLTLSLERDRDLQQGPIPMRSRVSYLPAATSPGAVSRLVAAEPAHSQPRRSIASEQAHATAPTPQTVEAPPLRRASPRTPPHEQELPPVTKQW